MTEHWVIYSKQKEINYISLSNIRASAETRLPKLHNIILLQFSPPFIPDILWALISPPRALRGSAIHVFLVLIFTFVYLFPIYDEFTMNLSQASFISMLL